tara:strand:+ start:444 stop:1823 length:1380 start_codon:yes stop_codon:yes gene_type:complete
MRGFGNKKERDKKDSQAITFSVPLSFEKIEDNIFKKTIIDSKLSKNQIINQAFKLHSQGNISEAANYYQYFIKKGFKDHRVFSNLGIILKDIGKFKEAEIYTRKAIELKPDFVDAYSNLGTILKKLDNLKEAELSTRKAIKINPALAQVHSNLGTILKDIGNFKEAELSFRKAIELKPNLAPAHQNLGSVLMYLRKFEDAEKSFRKAIELKQPYDIAYRNLSICLYLRGENYSALENILKANSTDPNEEIIKKLLTKVFKGGEGENIYNKYKVKSNGNNSSKDFSRNNPLILNRKVEPDLIDSLYKIKSIDQELYIKPTYGNARGSDYFLFERNETMIKMIKQDLTSIASKAVNSDIFISESFFTISKSGAGLVSHNHLNNIDILMGPKLSDKKFSLVYYLSIGDQNCEEPGILKLEEPFQEILPTNGLIILFPSKRKHSVFYKGTKDRIIIGVNFYSI